MILFNINIYVYIQFNIYSKFWLCFPILQLLLDPSHLHTYLTWCFFLLFQKNPQKKQTKDQYKRRQTKWNKNPQKYHQTCVVLPNYSWPWILPQSVFDPPSGSNMIHDPLSDIILEKDDLPFLSSYQFHMTSNLNGSEWNSVHSPLSVLVPSLAWTFAALCMLPESLSFYVHLTCD